MKKFIKVFLVVMVGVIGFAGGVYADNIIQSLDVTYDNSESGLESTNVQDALDELYVKAGGKILGDSSILKEHIINLYLNNKDMDMVVNNGITYSYAKSVGLMNDRLGTGGTTDYDAGNVRYYGANPNNYIYFNCSDYSNQTDSTCEKWRIIGVVDGKVKIIKSSSISTKIKWNSSESNNYNSSYIKTYLNGTFYDSLNNDETRSLISLSTWYLGGYKTAGIFSNDIFNYERTEQSGTTLYGSNKLTAEANIGLMNASDYGYATDLSQCTKNLGSYETTGCYNTNYLYYNSNQWILTQNPAYSYYVWYISTSGSVFSNKPAYEYLVCPTLYLNPDLTIESDDDGSSIHPYRLVVK